LYSARSFVFTQSCLFPLPQQFSLNCCCATPRRSKHGELLRQNGLFSLFAAVVKSPKFRFFAKWAFEIDEFAEFFDRRECLWHANFDISFSSLLIEGNLIFCFKLSTASAQSAKSAHLPLMTSNFQWRQQQQQQAIYLFL
jgi:hypothetical protein